MIPDAKSSRRWFLLAWSILLLLALLASQAYFNAISARTAKRVEQAAREVAASNNRQAAAQPLPDDMFHLHQTALQLQQDRFTLELEKQKQQLFWYNIGFLGVGGVLGFMTLLFWLPKQIEAQAKREVDEQLADIVRGRSAVIRRLLMENDYENTLMKEKRICITGGAGSGDIRNLLLEAGFSSENVRIVEQNEVEKTVFDLLFINNQRGDFLIGPPAGKEKDTEAGQRMQEQHDKVWENTIKPLIESARNNNRVVFYYNENQVNLPIGKLSDFVMRKGVNFATNPAQITGNLINLLKYQDRMTR